MAEGNGGSGRDRSEEVRDSERVGWRKQKRVTPRPAWEKTN